MGEAENGVTRRFNDGRGGHAQQQLTLAEQYKYCDQTRSVVDEVLEHIKSSTDVTLAHMGPNKVQKTARDKAQRKYGGDERYITDVVRGKIEVENAEQLGQVLDIFDDPECEILKKAGIVVVDKDDNFSVPKQYTWYRGLKYNLAVPTEDGKPQIIELQVVSPAMEGVYDVTHGHKRAAEEIYNTAAREERPLSDDEIEKVTQHYAVCQYYNSKTAYEEGYDRFLKDPEKYAFTDIRRAKLEDKMYELGVEPQ